MSPSSSTDTNLSFVPLGAGDLIDRAVRLYRRDFFTLILIAAPPVIIGTIFTVIWTAIARELLVAGTEITPEENIGYIVFVWLGTMVIWFVETAATLSVMGGASRNFVRHMLFDEPISFRETYRNTWNRIGGLIAASSIVTAVSGFVGLFTFYFCFFIAAIFIGILAFIFAAAPVVAVIFSIIVGIAIALGGAFGFSFISSRLAYVPQIMTVEGQDLFTSLSRSVSLAKGNTLRFGALVIFTTVAAYSALALLYVPLGWYAWWAGVSLFGFDGSIVPQWYVIAKQLLWQASFILLSPVWMVGLCVLYIDERVRHEGYDIELLAAQRLGEIPESPAVFGNPLQPAIGSVVPETIKAEPRSSLTTLGLK